MSRTGLKRLEGEKLYYSISEVCALTGLEQHVLRYWESEFTQLRPKKNRAGNRAYRPKDVQIIRYIKTLLYEEMYTIQGAKKRMTEVRHSELEGQTDLLDTLVDFSDALEKDVAVGSTETEGDHSPHHSAAPDVEHPDMDTDLQASTQAMDATALQGNDDLLETENRWRQSLPNGIGKTAGVQTDALRLRESLLEVRGELLSLLALLNENH